LGTIAVVERRAADGVDVGGVFDLAYAAELFAENFDFAGELIGIGGVLVVATSAAREERAWGGDAVGRRGQHFRQAGVDAIVDVEADGLAGKHEGREDYAAFETSQGFTAVYPLLDGY
jgi:hypothetical protein